MNTQDTQIRTFPFRRENLALELEQTQEEYCLLLDEEDIYPEEMPEKLAALMEEPGTAFAMPAAMLQDGKEVGKEAAGLQKEGSRILQTNEAPPVIPTGLAGLLFRTRELRAAWEAVSDGADPEKQVLVRLLQQKPKFGFCGECLLQYAQPREQDAQYNPYALEASWYREPLERFLLPSLRESAAESGEASAFLQRLAVYMVHIRIQSNLNNRNKHVLEREELPAFRELIRDVYRFVQLPLLINPGTVPCKVPTAKDTLLDIHLRENDFSLYPELQVRGKCLVPVMKGVPFDNCGNLGVAIHLIDYLDGNLEIDGSMEDLFSADSASLVCRFGKQEYPVVYNQRYSMTKAFGVTYARKKTFHVRVPVDGAQTGERLLNFYLVQNGKPFRLRFEFPSHTSRFSRDFTYSCWRFGGWYSFWNEKGIHVLPRDPLKELYKELQFIRYLWKKKKGKYRDACRLEVLNFLLRPYFAHRRIWLFQDKIYKAGDSSEYLYKYAAGKKDGIHCYYLLDEQAPDYARMRKEGYRPLRRGSLKHRLVFLNADLVIASNSTVFAFNDYTFDRSVAIRGRIHSESVCVQHGMSVQKIALAQQRIRDNTKLYFCASRYEIENLSKPVYDYMGYPYQCLYLTGVPRYDGLKDRAEKVLLFSPTWRMQAAMPVRKNEGVERDYNPHFRETDYFRVYNGLLNDPRLLEAARRYGYRIQYILHPIISPQLDDFDKNDMVEIIPATGEMSYEKLFCESALMVTDYSGVQFDFAYMRKPVVYLHHHDIPQHYEEGTFHYDTMSFGEICHTSTELVEVLCRYMENDCVMPEKYRARADDFFAFSDHSNCERIYPVMLEYTRRRFH